jgi:hypothetical protein
VWGIGLPVVLFHALTLWLGSNLPTAHVLPLGLLLVIGFRFIVTLKLFQFFDRLKDGHLFDAKTVGNLDAAGAWWIVLWLYDLLFHEVRLTVFQISDDWNSGSSVWNLLNWGGLFAGLALMFAAWLLKEAQELQAEQELTV